MIFLNFLVLPFMAFATTPLAMDAKADSQDYLQFLESHPEYTQLVHDNVRAKPNGSLERLLVKAQLEYLNGSMEKAKTLFQKITNRQHDEHWGLKDRSRINYGFFRMAQLTRDYKHWLNLALAFDSTLPPDTNLFPKEINDAWLSIKRTSKNRIIALPENARHFERVVVNGQDVPVTQGLLKTTEGLKKISFLSNRYKSLHFTMEVKDLEALAMNLQELATGNCQSPLPNPRLLRDAHIFYSSACVRDNSPLESAALVSPQVPTRKTSTSLFWKKNKALLWVGATLIGAAVTVAIAENQRRGGAATPPTAEPTQSASQEPPDVIVMTNR